jgi:D-alanyl-lipoteichoic acid acyltransferase DltB (MBOAT superfamily)
MQYNSLQFIFFYIIVTILYWQLPHRHRWLLLLLASCFFYMVFVPVLIVVIAFIIAANYGAGIAIDTAQSAKTRKILLLLAISIDVAVLMLFKYYNFFNSILSYLLALSQHHSPLRYLNLLLPIGLSFHTFQAISYLVEVYKRNQKAERNPGIFAVYIMFYPQLIAGPIERPQNMLWQFYARKQYDFEEIKSGLMQMAFGLFKKMVIADRVGDIVDRAYANAGAQNGKTFLTVAVLYSFQIYCDFSGYSDIAIGAARTMGFKLTNNFNVPYLAASFSEFWRKWHISLSTWFRDYLYIPLGGSRVGETKKYFNLLIIFLISGLWHGANLTFVCWGLLHCLFLITENIKDYFWDKHNKKQSAAFIVRVLRIGFVFAIVTLLWVFFRSPDLQTAGLIFQKIFSQSVFSPFNYSVANKPVLIFSFLLIAILMLKEYYFLTIPTRNTTWFYVVFSLMLIACYLFGVSKNIEFIYFQF